MKTMKQLFLACLMAGSLSLQLNAQVGFNNPAPDASSVVDIKATDKGLLIPRLTKAQRDAMLVAATPPANGLLVFDTDLNRLYFCYNNGALKKWLAINPWVTEDDQTALNKDMYTLVLANTGINTQVPKSKLSVGGNFAVGATYAGANAAPANGAIIEGNVGIGKTNPGTALDVNGTITSTGEIVNGTVTATNYANNAAGNGPVPQGGIIMWSGSIASIPTGWQLCDGSGGTPDLRERFIVGAGASDNVSVTGTSFYAVSAAGGENTHILSTAEMPSHTHTGTTTTDGDHTHDWLHGQEGDDSGTGGSNNEFTYAAGTQSGMMSTNGAHNHTFTTASTGSSSAHENRPPYYALAYIMKS